MKGAASLLLRVGLAFTLLYAAFAALGTPESWVGFIPQAFLQLAEPERVLFAFSVGEIVLALWLLSGLWIRVASSFAAVFFFAVTFANLGALDVVFRDAGLMFASLALITLHS